MIKWAVQAKCLCRKGPNRGRWRQALGSQNKPIIYAYRGRAERIARGLAIVWEPDQFRVVKVEQ